jgi:hypothetical protein
MAQLDDMLRDIEIADPAVEAALTALNVAEEMAILLRAETKIFEGETRQILKANLALRDTSLSSLEVAQAAIALARRWHL